MRSLMDKLFLKYLQYLVKKKNKYLNILNLIKNTTLLTKLLVSILYK